MSLNNTFRFILNLLFFVFINLPVNCFSYSIWSLEQHYDVPRISENYTNAECVSKQKNPYTGSLQLQSKYDQSDPTKSTLTSPDSKTQKIKQHLEQYISELSKNSKQYHDGLKFGDINKANKAIFCFNIFLENWADADAMLSQDANGTGQAARKFFLAALSSSILRIQALSNGQYQLSQVQKDWLENLGNLVIDEYTPRRTKKNVYFNNHDYWAAWAVTSTGIVLRKADFLIWGHENLKQGLKQITVSNHGNYGYLPFEVTRGKLAADYSNYAMIPLSLLVESAKRNDSSTLKLKLSDDELYKFQQLATFTARSVLEPNELPELKGTKQQSVGNNKLVWIFPFLSMYPEHEWAKTLYTQKKKNISSSQLGGDIGIFYHTIQ
jgi:Alginate lyase.